MTAICTLKERKDICLLVDGGEDDGDDVDDSEQVVTERVSYNEGARRRAESARKEETKWSETWCLDRERHGHPRAHGQVTGARRGVRRRFGLPPAQLDDVPRTKVRLSSYGV